MLAMPGLGIQIAAPPRPIDIMATVSTAAFGATEAAARPPTEKTRPIRTELTGETLADNEPTSKAPIRYAKVLAVATNPPSVLEPPSRSSRTPGSTTPMR